LKNLILFVILILSNSLLFGQQEKPLVRAGNKLYKEKQYDQSLEQYKKAITVSPANPLANYNMGNAQFRTNRLDEAVTSYDASISSSKKKPIREKGFYNKGVVYSKQQKLEESINAWKNALKLDPDDQEARENLQKALLEQKKQEQQKQKEDEKKKDKKDQKKEQDKEKKQQEPKQQSNLTKKQVEQLLKALQQKEKEVNEKLQSRNSSPSQQEKDW
jgi:tetratricopeptide (TPR) repeat protein